MVLTTVLICLSNLVSHRKTNGQGLSQGDKQHMVVQKLQSQFCHGCVNDIKNNIN